MSMLASRLGASLKAKIDAIAVPSSDATYSLLYWTAVAEAMIDEVTDNAEIAPLTQTGITISPGAVLTQGQTQDTTGAIS